MKVIEYQRFLFEIGNQHRFIINGYSSPIKWDAREYWCWYYNQQLYVAESTSTLGRYKDTVAYLLHSDFSSCYPRFPKIDFLDLLKTKKTLGCVQK